MPGTKQAVRVRPDKLETLRLALELMRRIPRHRKVTAAQLQQQLADAGIVRDLRTIQRQLEMLCEHFGVEREPTRPIGYRWKERGYGLSMAAMSEHEALLLTLAHQHLAALLPPPLAKSMDGFFREAQRNLAPFGDDRLAREWLSKVLVVGESVKLIPPKIAAGVLETVSQTLYANHWLKLRYRNAEGRASAAQVMPLGLAQDGPRMYLVCRYEGEDKDRSLALHRMQSAQATTLAFKRPADFDLRRFDDEGRLAFGDGSQLRLSFRIARKAGAHLLESPLSTDQVVSEQGPMLHVTATVVASLKLDRWLLGFGKDIADVRREPVGPPAAGAEAAKGRRLTLKGAKKTKGEGT